MVPFVSLHSHPWLPWIGLLDMCQDEKPRLVTADVLLGIFEDGLMWFASLII